MNNLTTYRDVMSAIIFERAKIRDLEMINQDCNICPEIKHHNAWNIDVLKLTVMFLERKLRRLELEIEEADNLDNSEYLFLLTGYAV